jgi:hypothetical protein
MEGGVGVLLQIKHIAIKLYYFENGHNKINTLYEPHAANRLQKQFILILPNFNIKVQKGNNGVAIFGKKRRLL